MDLEHSFGPAYVRGRLLKGSAADAVIGVGEASPRRRSTAFSRWNSVARLLRQHTDARRHFGALKSSFRGAWRTTAERMAWLNHAAADFELFTLDERSEELAQVDFRDTAIWSRALFMHSRRQLRSSAADPESTGFLR